MTDEIRRIARERLDAAGITNKAVAKALDMSPATLSSLLNDTSGRGGKIPVSWQKLLDFLGLEVTVKPKRGSTRTGPRAG